MYPTLSIFQFDIPMYGLLTMIGILVSVLFCVYRATCQKLKVDDLIYALSYAFVGGIIGAKLLYLILNISDFWIYSSVIFASIKSFSLYLSSGFIFYGGLFGVFIGFFLYGKEFHIDMKPYLIACIPAIPLFHIFGRMACYSSGCCYGVEMQPPLGMIYHSDIAAITDTYRFPVQLLEAFSNMLIFIFLLIKTRNTTNYRVPLGWYLVLYAMLRFILEFYRGDDIRGILLLSTSQWISILCFGFGIYMFIGKERIKKNI